MVTRSVVPESDEKAESNTKVLTWSVTLIRSHLVYDVHMENWCCQFHEGSCTFNKSHFIQIRKLGVDDCGWSSGYRGQ